MILISISKKKGKIKKDFREEPVTDKKYFN